MNIQVPKIPIGSLVYLDCSIIIPAQKSKKIQRLDSERVIRFCKYGVKTRPTSYDTGLVGSAGTMEDQVEDEIIPTKLDFNYHPVAEGEEISCDELIERAQQVGAIGSLLFGKLAIDLQDTELNILPIPVEIESDHQIALPNTILGHEVAGVIGKISDHFVEVKMPYLNWNQFAKKWELKFASPDSHVWKSRVCLILMK
ncbi:MAG: hypothetical protein WC575_02795 [Patescibacteria group bacterium]